MLGSIPYQRNEAVLHTDETLLPRRAAARAAWNYHLPAEPQAAEHRHLLDESSSAGCEVPSATTASRSTAPRRSTRAGSSGDRLRPPGLHALRRRGAGQARRDQRYGAQDALLRGLLGLGLSRGRRALRAEGLRPAGGLAMRSALYFGSVRHRRSGAPRSESSATACSWSTSTWASCLEHSTPAGCGLRGGRHSPGSGARTTWATRPSARGVGPPPGRRAHRQPPRGADRATDPPALLRTLLQPGQLLLLLEARGRRARGGHRPCHQHPLGREPRLRDAGRRLGRPRHREGLKRPFPEALARLPADGHGARIRAARDRPRGAPCRPHLIRRPRRAGRSSTPPSTCAAAS